MQRLIVMTEERYRSLLEKDKKIPDKCENCINFYQHYVKRDANAGGYVKINMGHCRYPRLKNRRPDDCCQHFRQRKDENDG